MRWLRQLGKNMALNVQLKPSLPKLVVMASGNGSNLQALIDATQAGHLKAQIALVVVNRKGAYALTRAEQANIPTLYFPLKPYTDAGKSRADYDADLAAKLMKLVEPDLIVLAGWMHVFSEAFLTPFAQRVINLHPALPGAFPGVDAIKQSYQAFVRGEVDAGGCMVHYVVPEVDAGPVIAQAVVHLDLRDTYESYETRIHAAEHQIIVHATALVLEKLSRQPVPNGSKPHSSNKAG